VDARLVWKNGEWVAEDDIARIGYGRAVPEEEVVVVVG
jgi:hypothetical protein